MRRLTITLVFVVALIGSLTQRSDAKVIGGGDSPSGPTGGDTTILAWAAASGHPSGGSGSSGKQCAYTVYTGIGIDSGVDAQIDPSGLTTYNGQQGHFYTSTCESTRLIWVPLLSAQDLATIAYREVIRKLTNPQPVFAPPLSKGGYVNLKTWMAVPTAQAVFADASVPGIGVRTTAEPDHIEWDPGDGSTVVCQDLGAQYASGGPIAPACGWTPAQPSAPKFTGTDDLAYHGTFRLVWTISWTSTTGAGGDLGSAVTHADTAYKVMEIQTIGDG